MANKFISELGNFIIEIADDKFSAYLTVTQNIDFMNEKELLDVIEQSKINYGFDEARVLAETKEIQKNVAHPFPFAVGLKPKDPEIEFSPLFDKENCYDISIGNNFAALSKLKRVKKGDPLAHLFVTKQSKSGINIFGEEVEPEKIENQLIENYLGENVSYSHERGQIIAEKTGYPYMDELSTIHVKNEFTLDKNLDLTFADMDFFGSLVINGNIMDKVKVKLDGDLTVNGDINDAEIEVNGNITVNGDIINCKSPGVLATGSIIMNSAENSKIVAGNKIKFNKNIHFCRIIAEKGIFGQEDVSSIVGGIYQSGEHIEVAVIGNTGGIGTEVEISISPYTKETMVNLTKQMNKLKELELNKTLEYQNLQEEQNSLELKLEDEINAMLKNQDNLPKHIIAYKKVFPGTYIRILKKSIHIVEELNKVSFSIVGGELVNESY